MPRRQPSVVRLSKKIDELTPKLPSVPELSQTLCESERLGASPLSRDPAGDRHVGCAARTEWNRDDGAAVWTPSASARQGLAKGDRRGCSHIHAAAEHQGIVFEFKMFVAPTIPIVVSEQTNCGGC